MSELVISGKNLYNYLIKNWAEVIRSKWSHFFIKYNNKVTIIPIHNKKDLPQWTLRKIMKDLNLTKEDIKKAK